MKITILTCLVFFSLCSLGQIKKNGIDIRKDVKIQIINKGLDISNLKIRGLRNIEKLDIPVVTIPNDFPNLRPVKTWRVTPSKIKDGNLTMYYFKGQLFNTSWYVNKYFTNLYPRSGLVPPEIHRDLDLFYDTPLDGGGGLTPPLILKFLASKNVQYRLKFKVENRQLHDRMIAVLINNHISNVRLNTVGQFIYAFNTASTHVVKIGIGALDVNRNTEFLKIAEIKIDQIRN